MFGLPQMTSCMSGCTRHAVRQQLGMAAAAIESVYFDAACRLFLDSPKMRLALLRGSTCMLCNRRREVHYATNLYASQLVRLSATPVCLGVGIGVFASHSTIME